MNLVEQLMKADVKKADEMNEGIFLSKKLASILGQDEPVPVKIREINGRRVNDIVSYQLDRKGDLNFSRTYDAKLMMCIEGVADPDLMDKDLQAHFGVSNAKDLAEKLFGNEVTSLSDAISLLSGISGDEDEVNEIKN